MKLYYTIGEVAEMFSVNTSLIRYWENEFDVLIPKKNNKGNRLFTASDIENVKIIYNLVKEQGLTLDGAKRYLKENKKTIKHASKDNHAQLGEISKKLITIKAQLLSLRETI
jgi:DNA-binding transcriptional MerR regulator